jgi:hypothetical protein
MSDGEQEHECRLTGDDARQTGFLRSASKTSPGRRKFRKLLSLWPDASRPTRYSVAAVELEKESHNDSGDNSASESCPAAYVPLSGLKKNKRFECDETFASQSGLCYHTMAHRGGKPFKSKSKSCGKSYTHLRSLNVHMRTHSREKPLQCNTCGCGRSFTQQSHLTQHTRTHHEDAPTPTRETDLIEVDVQCGGRYVLHEDAGLNVVHGQVDVQCGEYLHKDAGIATSTSSSHILVHTAETVINPCSMCNKRVMRGWSLKCVWCNRWVHQECTGLTRKGIEDITENSTYNWNCQKCLAYVIHT